MTVPTQRSAGAVAQLKTRKPTCLPPWPLILIAGAEKSGKSFALAQASASDFIARTLWVGMGEDAPDEYGAIPGARFEIVEHDGTYRGILAAFTAAVAQPRVDGKPNLIGGDSATRLWDLICGMAQVEANRRAASKAAKFNKPIGEDDVPISMDLWNVAKSRWEAVIDVLRSHDGPVILTARLETVTVMNDRGEPTKDKAQKVKAEKSLPYDVGVVVELPARGEAYLTGVRSLRFQPKEDRTRFPDFTVEKLWEKLGVTAQGATAPRQHDGNVVDRSEHIALINQAALMADSLKIARDKIKADWAKDHDGENISDATDLEGLKELVNGLAAEVEIAAELSGRQELAGVSA